MVTAPEIIDWKTLSDWLEGRRREDLFCIGHRCAMRAAPQYWQGLNTPEALQSDLTPLTTLWPLLTAGVARKFPTPEVIAAAYAAVRPTHAFAGVFALSSTGAAASAARSAAVTVGAYLAADNATDAAATATVAVTESATASAAATDAAVAWSSVRWDCLLLENHKDPDLRPLWDGSPPERVRDHWATVRARWVCAGGPAWTFWVHWYENALEGRPQDWPLLRDIALIPAEDWIGGPDRVHPIIEKMLIERERQKLLDQVSALTAELHEARRIISEPVASATERSHNMPPELVDVESEAQRAIAIIWADLQDAKVELEKHEPEPSVLRRIGQKLLGAVAAFSEYGATIADIALRKAAEEIGSTGTKWALRILVVYFAAPAGTVQTIGTGLIELAKMLGSP